MHPAPSVILFTVLSGLGFGFLMFLDAGLIRPAGPGALVAFGLAYALAAGGLVASMFHLGNPQRALLAFTQWRSSWLSREAWASATALLASAPVAWGALGGAQPGLWGMLAAVLCLITILCTSMIYAQLKTVPRWHHWTTPATYLGFALAGAAIFSGTSWAAALLCLILGGLMVATFATGDRRFARAGASLGSATGLGHLGDVRVFEPAHTASNYVMREMIHVVGRKHARKLRVVALIGAALLPAVILVTLPTGLPTVALALVLHLIGAFAQRWLFFAEAEHVVSHYYGRH